jgi:malonate-semialdehyde dehydrogenase (acetylating)/methylmalonate-semialdehyde dehydrogenase
MELLNNYINGSWEKSYSTVEIDVIDPGSQEVLWKVPLGNREDVESAVKSASEAAESWRNTPATARIQYLFKLKSLLEDNREEISNRECGSGMWHSRSYAK